MRSAIATPGISMTLCGTHLATSGARAVPARSTSLGRGGLEHSCVFPPAMLLRTGPSPRRSGFGHAGGTVRGPAAAPLCVANGSHRPNFAFSIPAA